MPEERLQKILSRAGVSSRRKAEQMMLEGRVVVNGEIVTELGSKADLDRDHIKVDGKPLRKPKRTIYLAMNKPNNCVTTVSDPEGRATVMDFLHGMKERVYPVGRLDYHSEGLLLLTNDGDMANLMMSKRTKLVKTYVVKVNGIMLPDEEKQFREGISLDGKKTLPASLKEIKRTMNPWYEVKLTEGRQNQIRLMFKYFGKQVEKLRRVQIGFLKLDLPVGKFRHLTPAEVDHFKSILKMNKTEDR